MQTAKEIVRGLCVRFEGVFLKPYLCPAGIPTIGVGSTTYEDGKKVTLADPPIPKERAYYLLDFTLDRIYLPAVVKNCPVALGNPRMHGALGDFAYNLGVTRLAGSTLRRKINQGDIVGAKLELKKWVRGGGKILPGLVARAAARSALLDNK